MENIIVFDRELDKKLLDNEPAYKIHKSIRLNELILHKEKDYDYIDKELIKLLRENGFDLNQPFIAHLCNRKKFGDYLTILFNKQFYLNINYHATGKELKGFYLAKWKDDETEYFTENMEFKPVIDIKGMYR